MRPSISCSQASCLVEELYGVRVLSIKELDSYDDRNFHVLLETDIHRNLHVRTVHQYGYVFKVLNESDSQQNHIDAEHGMMRLLAERGFTCPEVMPNVLGADWSQESLTGENPDFKAVTSHKCRLLTFVPGQVMTAYDVREGLIRHLGEYTAKMHQALEGYDHEALHMPDFRWSLLSVLSTREYLPLVQDSTLRELVRSVLEGFERNVTDKYSEFRLGAIHGDLNDTNIVLEDTPKQEQLDGPPVHCSRVNGVIDFGDATYSYLVFDMAIAITYLMLNSGQRITNILDVGRFYLEGYCSVQDLPMSESLALPTCVAGRYAQSLLNSEYSRSQDPANEYLGLTSKLGGWAQLNTLWNTPVDEIRKHWNI